LLSVTPPNMSRGEAETTTLSSANMAREFIASWINAGEASFMVRMHKTQFATLFGFFTAGTILYWRWVLNTITGETTPSHVQWQGFVKSCAPPEQSTEDNNVVKANFSIKTTGLPTFSAGS
jgi:hypothetical protein